MSGTDRDRRGRTRSGKRCPEAQNGGCAYCVTGDCKKAARHKTRREGKQEARNEH